MSTLKESLLQRRKAELPHSRSCDSAETPVRMLQIDSWNRERWVFPWAHFIAAHHRSTDETEELQLLFADHEVVLNGARLALLMPEIAHFRLDSLSEMPSKFARRPTTTNRSSAGSQCAPHRIPRRPSAKPLENAEFVPEALTAFSSWCYVFIP